MQRFQKAESRFRGQASKIEKQVNPANIASFPICLEDAQQLLIFQDALKCTNSGRIHSAAISQYHKK